MGDPLPWGAKAEILWPTVLERYMAWLDSPATRRNYRIWLTRAFGDMGVTTLSDITLDGLEHYRAQVMVAAYAPATKKLSLVVLRSFLGWARAYGLHELPEDALRITLRIPKANTVHHHRSLTTGELRRLILASKPGRDRLIVALMAGLGLRVSECSHLDVRDYIPGAEPCLVIRDSKGHTGRILPVTMQLAPLLAAHAGHRNGPLFVAICPKGQRLGIAGIRERLEAASDLAGLYPRVTPHDLRHTFGTSHYRANKDVVATKTLLGHRSIETTMTYVHEAELAILRDGIPEIPL